MQLKLQTDRLLLRPLDLKDTELEIKLSTDPDVARFIGGCQSAEETRAEMRNYVKRGGGGTLGIWCVIVRETSEKIGTGVLLPMPVDVDDTEWDLMEGTDIPDREIEVGYALKQSAWGRGYGTEVCGRLLQFAFEETPLTEIVATTDDDNYRSVNVLGKCGLGAEGRRRAYGEMSLYFRITREQWLFDQQH